MADQALSDDELLEKLRSFCGYQERCSQQVRDKYFALRGHLGGWPEARMKLEEEEFLSDVRFAKLYVQSKFRQNKWGRVKIRHGLKQLRVPERAINSALASLPAEDSGYLHTVTKVLRKRLREKNPAHLPAKARAKHVRYLQGRGYEWAAIEAAFAACEQAFDES